MEEILKQILSKIDTLNEKLDAHDRSNQKEYRMLNERMDAHDRSNREEYRMLNERMDAHDRSNQEEYRMLNERMDAHDRSNREEFRKLDKKLDAITEVVAKTMEDVSGLKAQVEKQDMELKVISGR